jgi:2-polyprenyl-3-methyl-5-hydroxy-6-metoxy-1,4-benzoquinol methylase
MTVPSCPLCDWSVPTLVRSIDTSVLINEWRRVFQIDITPEMQGVGRIDLLECERCHLQFFSPNYLAGSEQLYVQLEKFEWYYMLRWEHDAALEDLRGCETMLEVGCGFGDFVARTRKSGIQAEGIELNASAVKAARQHGVPVQRLELRELAANSPVHYDAVCSFQVLEHVPNPREFLEWSCALTKPGGQLIICVPNAMSFLKYRFDPLDMPPHHMTRWSSQTMQSLSHWLPVRLQSLRYEPLASHHVSPYIQAQGAARLKNPWLRRAFDAVIVPGVSIVLKHSRLRRKLIGQTLYASFRRV